MAIANACHGHTQRAGVLQGADDNPGSHKPSCAAAVLFVSALHQVAATNTPSAGGILAPTATASVVLLLLLVPLTADGAGNATPLPTSQVGACKVCLAQHSLCEAALSQILA
jgi:hypothetical protein